MYNTKFSLENGKDFYPGYLTKEKRQALKKEYENKRQYMWCGCRNDVKLFYRISEDLRIYPEHNDFAHGSNCSRFRTPDGRTERKTAYVVDDQNGEVTVFLKFNPKNLKVEEETDSEDIGENKENLEVMEEIEEVVVESEPNQQEKKEKKEPKLSFGSLTRCINIDTYMDYYFKKSSMLSKEQFSKLVYARMGSVKINGMKKKIGELSLENDGVRFIYAPFVGCDNRSERGLKKCYVRTSGPDGKTYNNFTFEEIYQKAYKEFVKTYGMEPNQDTVMATFQYYKKTRKGTKYKILGRIHLFQVSDNGLYCRSIAEQQTFNTIAKMLEKRKGTRFYIPAEDETIGGIIEEDGIKKKILLIFRTKKKEVISFDKEIYTPMVIGLEEPFTSNDYNEMIAQIKEGME